MSCGTCAEKTKKSVAKATGAPAATGAAVAAPDMLQQWEWQKQLSRNGDGRPPTAAPAHCIHCGGYVSKDGQCRNPECKTAPHYPHNPNAYYCDDCGRECQPKPTKFTLQRPWGSEVEEHLASDCCGGNYQTGGALNHWHREQGKDDVVTVESLEHAAQTAQGKEPWQMTRMEYLATQRPVAPEAQGKTLREIVGIYDQALHGRNSNDWAAAKITSYKIMAHAIAELDQTRETSLRLVEAAGIAYRIVKTAQVQADQCEDILRGMSPDALTPGDVRRFVRLAHDKGIAPQFRDWLLKQPGVPARVKSELRKAHTRDGQEILSARGATALAKRRARQTQ